MSFKLSIGGSVMTSWTTLLRMGRCWRKDGKSGVGAARLCLLRPLIHNNQHLSTARAVVIHRITEESGPLRR